MSTTSDSRDAPAPKRAIVQIDRVVLASVLVGAGLAVLSSIGTSGGSLSSDSASAATGPEVVASFP